MQRYDGIKQGNLQVADRVDKSWRLSQGSCRTSPRTFSDREYYLQIIRCRLRFACLAHQIIQSTYPCLAAHILQVGVNIQLEVGSDEHFLDFSDLVHARLVEQLRKPDSSD